MDLASRAVGALLGLAVGDALGAAVEFQRPGSFEPVTNLRGGGAFDLAPGQWTDDTSMALCLAESLIEVGECDLLDQLSRYLRWYEEGYLSSTGHCFDIGNGTRRALERFKQTGSPTCGEPGSAGNGCLMRLAPVPLFYHQDLDAAMTWSGESSRTTHNSLEALEASCFFGGLLVQALKGKSKGEILSTAYPARHPQIQEIVEGSYQHRQPPQIHASGYVVPSLEAALWAFYHSESYEECVLKAVNLGDDADTVGAIAGQLAGSFYGVEGIPQSWVEQIAMKDRIIDYALQLVAKAAPSPSS